LDDEKKLIVVDEDALLIAYWSLQGSVVGEPPLFRRLYLGMWCWEYADLNPQPALLSLVAWIWYVSGPGDEVSGRTSVLSVGRWVL